MTNKAWLLVGSNINKEQAIKQAHTLLQASTNVIKVSAIYETLPIGPSGVLDQPVYFNQAYLIETDKNIECFNKDICKAIEKKLHRIRSQDRYAARTIDIDIVLWNDAIIETDNMDIPDPNILKQAYASIPLAEISPHYKHPLTQQALAKIAQNIAGSNSIFKSPFQLK